MQQIIFFTIVTLLGVCNSQNNPSILSTTGSLPDTSKWTPFICRAKGVFTPNDLRLVDIKACKTKTDQCKILCEGHALGLINADGSLTMDTYRKWIIASFPEQHKSKALVAAKDCFSKNAQFNTIPANVDCKVTKQFSECIWGVVPTLTCTPA